MRGIIACAAVTLGVMAAPSEAPTQAGFDFTGRHYAQLTAEHIDGSDDGLAFGADRIRTRWEATRGPMTGGIMLDFGVPVDLGERQPGALANVIADLFFNYRPNATHVVRFGQFKTPLGMDFNVSGGNMDITKRGMEAGLVLARDLGVMLSGRRVVGGFGYDVGIFNPAGRSLATAHSENQVGSDKAPVVRLHYDATRWDAELAHGRSEQAGGGGTLDYVVSDLAFRFVGERWSAKFEWIEGRDIRGIGDWDERVFFVHGGYRLNPRLELVARYYDGKNTLAGSSTSLTNTYLALTSHLVDTGDFLVRLQVNYVLAGGDGAAYSGLRGFRDDAILMQLQVEARH